MTDFDTTMQLAAAAMPECLGAESVTYTPRGGAARVISVVVQRLGIHPDLRVPFAQIKAREHATLGLAAATLDTGGDTIAWQPKPGGTARTGRITSLISANAGFVTVEVC
jgi:hypothetical protein